MRLIVEIPLDGNDLEEADFKAIAKESKRATGFCLEVGRSIGDGLVCRMASISAEKFSVKIVKD